MVLEHKGQIVLEEERRYLKEKFDYNTDLVDLLVRENTKWLEKTASTLKYYYSLNYYGERD